MESADEPTRLIRSLEAKYIDLLERRIAELENVVTNFTSKDVERNGKDAKADARDLTSNDRVQQFLTTSERGTDVRRDSVGSNTGSSPPGTGTKMRFRDIRYKDDGVEDIQEVSKKEALKVESAFKPKDSPDIIWTRRFGEDKKYKWSEVQVLSEDLSDFFRVEFVHDPRMHIVSDRKSQVSFLSPFGPLLQSWDSLQDLVKEDIFAEPWKRVGKKIQEKERDPSITTVKQNPDTILAKAKEDLITLLDHVRSSQDVETYLSAINTARDNGTIQFDCLWTIFPPGELVYSAPFMGKDQIFVVKECSSQFSYESDSGQLRDQRKVWHLHCWSYDWNGRHFTRVPVLFRFEDFTGAKLINTLHCHPCRYHFPGDDKGDKMTALREDLIKRGKLFKNYSVRKTGEQMFRYESDAISHGSGFQGLKNQQKQSLTEGRLFDILYGRRRKANAQLKSSELSPISGHIMVDFVSYLQHAPNANTYAPMGDIQFSEKDDECNCGSCMNNKPLRQNQRREFDRWVGEKEFEDEEQYLLCPPRVLGYHLETRTWLELNINEIKTIEETTSDKAFQGLQLEQDHKDLIKRLVLSHSSTTDRAPIMEDIVKGKGKGLVMLLHGPPGVGKTLTAESVASLTGKPLFAVTPSDIGLDPADVERNLEALFHLAARWRAVLLFDEADVFLESRSANTSDLTRNALVSVLLRVLEYYKGILILTTNRVRQFDIAVLSRINLGIKYEMLDFEQKKAIFDQFIETAKPGTIKKKDAITDWFRTSDAKEYFKPLNGRQIRNVLFSAASLGSSSGDEKLDLKSIKTMAKVTFKFQDGLRDEMVKWARISEAGRDHGD